MARIASATNRPNRSIIVTGHTDNVPVSGEFADNFDLAAARAASVVRELVATGQVDPARWEEADRLISQAQAQCPYRQRIYWQDLSGDLAWARGEKTLARKIWQSILAHQKSIPGLATKLDRP